MLGANGGHSYGNILFGRKPPSLEKARTILGKAEQLAELDDPMPAMQFMMSAEFRSIPTAIVGPGGPLHDRLLTILFKTKSRVEKVTSPSKQRVERNWGKLPSVVVITIGRSVNSRDVLSAARSSGKDLVCLMPLGSDIKEQDAHRQIDLSYEFADDPRLAFMVLEFNGLVMIRSSFLLQHGAILNTHTAEDLLMGLLEQTQRNGWNYQFVER
jgi:hypothetical protein